MSILDYRVSFFIVILFFLGCKSPEIPEAETPKTEISNSEALSSRTPIWPKKTFGQIDLTEIKHIAKGRAQSGTVQDEKFNELSIVNDLLAHGRDSIPFLISKLDDETKMDGSVIDFWYRSYVGDIALVISQDFFTKEDEMTSTIQGFGWDEFLERGNDKDSTGEAILRKYIKKQGRKKIKERWQKMWEQNKENIYWDDTERCFNLKQ
jgi:hypothetical protein